MDILPANFQALVKRFNYTFLRKIIGQLHIPVNVTSKQELGNILTNWACSTDLSEVEISKAAKLLSILEEHIIFSNKIIEIYQVNTEEVLKTLSNLLEINPDSVFSKKYGHNLATKDDLRELHKGKHYDLWRIISLDDEVHLIFTSVRDINDKEILEPNSVHNRDGEQFDEVYGIKYIYTQCFDVITIYKNNMIDIKLDYYRSNAGKSMPVMHKKDIQQTIGNLKDRFSLLLKTHGVNFIWKSPVNFKPIISQLITDKEIQALDVKQTDKQGYITSFSAIGDKDVREGTGYTGANTALNKVGDPPKQHCFSGSIDRHLGYRNPPLTYKVFIELSAAPTLHQTETSIVKNAIISGNLGQADYHMLRNKLLS